MTWFAYAWIRFSYWLRPYDMIADRRRWMWQRRSRCVVLPPCDRDGQPPAGGGEDH